MTSTSPRTVHAALAAGSILDQMELVSYASVPTDWRVPTHHLTSVWAEIGTPLQSQGGCMFGCKVYARRRGCVTEYAVCHSSIYGHRYAKHGTDGHIGTPESCEPCHREHFGWDAIEAGAAFERDLEAV